MTDICAYFREVKLTVDILITPPVDVTLFQTNGV